MTGDGAPTGLDLLEAFVNTAGLDRGRDDLATPAATAAWLAERGLWDAAGAAPTLDERDHARVLAAREALRALLLTHNGGAPAPAAAAELAAQAADARLAATVAADGTIALAPATDGWPGALARLLAIAARSQADGSWSRLKACPADDCGWAFYDSTRNHSRTWCSMATCGNREKARAYRRRTGGPGASD